MNSLFLISSIFDLVAAVATWAATSAAISVAGVSALGVVAGLAGALAIVAAVAGVVILMVILFKHQDPPETPVHKFVYNEAKNAGFFMEYDADIDFFDVLRDSNGDITASGVSMRANSNSNNSLQAIKHIDGTYTVSSSGVSSTWDTVFQLDTNEDGYTTITTRYPGVDDAPVLLTLDDNKKLTFVTALDDQTKVDQQKWKCTILGDVTWAPKSNPDDKTEDGILSQASFNLYNKYWTTHGDNKKYYLQANGTIAAESPAKFLFVMQNTRPDGLTMSDITVIASTDKNSGLSFYPNLPQQGSKPLSWSLSPPELPAYLEFNSSTGVISVKAETDLTVMSKTAYSIAVKNSVGSMSANFYITCLQDFPTDGSL